VKINSLDKYGRSPIFYCFDPDDLEVGEPNDKVELLQVMMNLADINLNLLDVYKRSVVHYACRKSYFFSILYLLDKNINMEIVDHEENTPLAICLRHRNLDQAAFIIRNGVRYGFVNDTTANGSDKKMSYFAYAIKNLSVGICFMLLDYGYPIQKALEEVPNEMFKEILKKKYIK
jgi:ankyrin repeat protein